MGRRKQKEEPEFYPGDKTGVTIDYGDGIRRNVYVPTGYKLDSEASEWEKQLKYGSPCVPPNETADRVRFEMALQHPRTHNRRAVLAQQQSLPQRGDIKPTSIPRRDVRDDGRGLF